MTIGDWIAARSRGAPDELSADVLRALGEDAKRDVSETTSACLSAASRRLSALVAHERFGRESALDLLVVDALTTFAYEWSGENADVDAIRRDSDRGITLIGNVLNA